MNTSPPSTKNLPIYDWTEEPELPFDIALRLAADDELVKEWDRLLSAFDADGHAIKRYHAFKTIMSYGVNGKKIRSIVDEYRRRRDATVGNHNASDGGQTDV